MTTPRGRRWTIPFAGCILLASLFPHLLHAQSAPPEGVERRWEIAGLGPRF